jgi:pilus assembly protein Flp/PilA
MFTKLAKRFWNDEQGLELSEYAVMAALIIVALIVIITALSTSIGNAFTNLTSTIDTANESAGT